MDKNRQTLIKGIGLLVVVIILFSIISRSLISGGETLLDYREKNPPQTQESEPLSTETIEESEPAIETPVETETEPEEVKADFYYEPLSAELIDLITGVSYPAEGTDKLSYEDLCYLHVLHVDFEGNTAEGELICNRAIAQDLLEIFEALYQADYQIEKISLIENYDGDDELSMADNNTSCFNYREVAGSANLSQHAYGLAVDINPLYNPHVRFSADGAVYASPEAGEAYVDRTQSFPYKIDDTDLCYKLFIEHGFTWGGNWNSSKDYQHFQKKID